MPTRVVAFAAAGAMVVTACAGGSSVEASVRDAFVDCMAEQGVTVEDVEVELGSDRHIQAFSWSPATNGEVDDTGQECEDAALQQFDVSRT